MVLSAINAYSILYSELYTETRTRKEYDMIIAQKMSDDHEGNGNDVLGTL